MRVSGLGFSYDKGYFQGYSTGYDNSWLLSGIALRVAAVKGGEGVLLKGLPILVARRVMVLKASQRFM